MSDVKSQIIIAIRNEETSGWMGLMELIESRLSHVLKQGKPSNQFIANSIIGSNGFSSWKELVETSIENGGLGWNIHAWKAYKRAWNTVSKYPYLRDLEISASMVNKMSQDLKDEFPKNLDEFEAFESSRKRSLEESHSKSLSRAKKRIEELTEALRESENLLTGTKHGLSFVEDKNKELTNQLDQLKSEFSDLKKENKSLAKTNTQMKNKIRELENRSFLNRMKSSFKSFGG